MYLPSTYNRVIVVDINYIDMFYKRKLLLLNPVEFRFIVYILFINIVVTLYIMRYKCGGAC